jgi:hypothetical protein
MAHCFPRLLLVFKGCQGWGSNPGFFFVYFSTIPPPSHSQGCQMVSFQTKNSQFGYILEDLGMKNAFWSFEIVYDQWVYLMGIW